MNKFADAMIGLGLLVGLLGTVVAAYFGTLELSTQCLKTGVASILVGGFFRALPQSVKIKEQKK